MCLWFVGGRGEFVDCGCIVWSCVWSFKVGLYCKVFQWNGGDCIHVFEVYLKNVYFVVDYIYGCDFVIFFGSYYCPVDCFHGGVLV